MLKGVTIIIFILVQVQIYSQYQISGRVTNDNGESIEFASVFLEGTSAAAISKSDGSYSIENVKPGKYSIKCTYLGYLPVIIPIEIVDKNLEQNFTLNGEIYQLDKIEIIANRVDNNDAFTYSNIEKEELEKWNNGQDMPYLLRFTPSVVATSDAGNGIGYTGVRIRGTDATRINVTINGIPVNDAESQGVFWVNMPDFGSSVENIQIQRGVGTSTSGAGAFGGSISLNTKSTHVNPYASVSAGMGSFATNRLSIKVGTGLINDKYSIDLRYSSINSDGYIDRASSKLRSLFFGASRISENSSTRFQVILGSEVTYQAWYGVPESKLSRNRMDLETHYLNNVGVVYETRADSINLFDSDRRYNYYMYENQVDDYGQTHIQLHDHRKISDRWVFNSALNYTHGSGFFEEFKFNENLEDYGITSMANSDLVRRRWLDNDFYGGNLNLHYHHNSWQMTTGISAFQYDGDHFGKLVSVEAVNDFTPGDTYYFNNGNKTDISVFTKSNLNIGKKLSIFADVQIRNVSYEVLGDDNDGLNIDLDADFTFFNPKMGVSFAADNKSLIYASVAIANKEPNRSDFVDNQSIKSPDPERLYDLELGYKYQTNKFYGELVFYNMAYKDQLVLTGALNDVGSPLRTNVPESHRRGMELNLNAEFNRWKLGFSSSVSENKINEFNEILYDYTDGFQEIVVNHRNTDIAFSPAFTGTGQIGYSISSNLDVTLMHQLVSEQYLDNTSNQNRRMDGYLVGDLLLEYSPKFAFAKNFKLKGEVRNIWNSTYASNGYTYSYLFNELITENYFYPQATRNFMISLILDFGQ